MTDEQDDKTPPTLTMGWADRDDEPFVAEDTNPDMLIWPVDEELHEEVGEDVDSLRETVRDARAFERTQIIDMDSILPAGELASPSDDHALSDLAGAVGHELNNPLTTCVGYLRQLSSMVSNDDDQMALMLDRLGRNLNRIHSIVGELELLAAESNDQRQRLDLAAVVERVHDQLGSFLDADVELRLRPAYLRADRPRLYQLVYIMLAAHMLDSEGDNACTVRVSSRAVGACLEITSPKKPEGSLRLDLLGILRRNTVDGSTPLGLAAQLTREMGGQWFESAVDAGFRVSAVLPRHCPNAPVDNTDHTTQRRPGRPAREDYPKTSPGSHCNSAANRFDTSSRSRR